MAMISPTIETLETLKEKGGGVILVDKPETWSSHDVVGWMRKQLGIRRIGHAGTLDPLATGLLVVLVGREFTKLQDQFMKQDKVYEVRARFGQVRDTYDATGQVISETPWPEVKKITRDQVEQTAKKFLGKIQQTVPIYSAVKVGGQKLYHKARQGEKVESLPVREIEIHDLKVTDFALNEEEQLCEATFWLHVSSGTYIRSFVHDLGQELGVGAYVVALRRTKIGNLSVKDAFKPSAKRTN